MTAHALVMVDRGANHVHRWWAHCSCGSWVGVYRRRRPDAVKLHRQHAEAQVAAASNRSNGRRPRPQPLTPVAALPDSLR